MQKSASSVYRPIAMQFFKDMLETLTEAQRTQAIEFMTYIIFSSLHIEVVFILAAD